MEKTNSSKTKLTGKHVLFMFLAFFGVIFIVNGIFLSQAIKSFPGEISKKSYVQGINYNDTIHEKHQQVLLGWRSEIGVMHSEDTQKNSVLVARFFDKDDQPLNELQVNAVLNQHSSKHQNVSFPMQFSANGEYAHPIDSLETGRWTVQIEVKKSSEIFFKAQKEIFIP